MITGQIISRILSNAQVTALVAAPTGATPAFQVYPSKAPQGTGVGPGANPTYITVRQRDGDHVMSMSGREGTAKSTFEVVAYSDDAETAAEVIRRVGGSAQNPGLLGFRGNVTVGTDTINILGIFQNDDDERWLAAVHSDEVGVHTAGAAFTVWHTEQQN